MLRLTKRQRTTNMPYRLLNTVISLSLGGGGGPHSLTLSSLLSSISASTTTSLLCLHCLSGRKELPLHLSALTLCKWVYRGGRRFSYLSRLSALSLCSLFVLDLSPALSGCLSYSSVSALGRKEHGTYIYTKHIYHQCLGKQSGTLGRLPAQEGGTSRRRVEENMGSCAC